MRPGRWAPCARMIATTRLPRWPELDRSIRRCPLPTVRPSCRARRRSHVPLPLRIWRHFSKRTSAGPKLRPFWAPKPPSPRVIATTRSPRWQGPSVSGLRWRKTRRLRFRARRKSAARRHRADCAVPAPAISGRAVAAVLGSARLLDEGNRYNAIAALARSAHAKQPLAPLDVVSILDGTTQVPRAAAIAQLATWIAVGLSGEDAAAILGRGGELTEGNRYNAITALAHAGRFRGSLTGDEMAVSCKGRRGRVVPRRLPNCECGHATDRIAADRDEPCAARWWAGPPSTTAGTTPVSSAPSSPSGVPLPAVSMANMRDMANAYPYAQLSEAAYTTPNFVQTVTPNATMRWTRVWGPSWKTTTLALSAAVYVNEAKAICAMAFAGSDKSVDSDRQRPAIRRLDADQASCSRAICPRCPCKALCMEARGLRMTAVLTGHYVGRRLGAVRLRAEHANGPGNSNLHIQSGRSVCDKSSISARKSRRFPCRELHRSAV